MPELEVHREGPTPRDSATLVVVRDAPGRRLEVFCVERQKIGFLGGAVVFPGGKLDAGDLDPAWEELVTPPQPTCAPLAADATAIRGLAIAACREALEEAAILPVAGETPSHADLIDWRTKLAGGTSALREILAARRLKLDLGSLHPLARWITPAAEPRRFDTRFFLFVAESTLRGAHDDHETTASFWATPSEVLGRHASGDLVLAPPTHRTLEVLSAAVDTADAVSIASRACLEPICPRLVSQRDAGGDTIAIVLPGDPEHDVRVARVAGKSRFVLRGVRFFPEDPAVPRSTK
jgi:8-oxo-dGTP pyrophosphatase MutT (NUDIX family)